MTGVCITLCPRKHEERVPYIERKAGFKFERMGPPQPAEMASIAAER
jgi:ATP-dependent RNA helicase DDX21